MRCSYLAPDAQVYLPEDRAMEKVTNIRLARAIRELIKSLDAADWNLHRPVSSAVELGGPTVYIYDVETGYRQLVIYPKDGLSSIAQKAATLRINFQDSCNYVAVLVGELSNSNTSLGSDAQTALKVATGIYLMGTQIYGSTNSSALPLHYLILRYPDAQTGDYLLRPSGVMTDRMLTPSEIEDCAQELLAIDRMQHPERFVKDKDVTSPTQGRSPSASSTSPNNSGTPTPKPRPGR